MAQEHTTRRRRSVRTTLLAIVAVATVAAGIATGIQALGSSATAGILAPAPTAATAINDPAGGGSVGKATNGAARPLGTSSVTPPACRTMEEATTRTNCGFPSAMQFVAPKATWMACKAMDETTYRQLCHLGDGGRWIEGSTPARP